MNVETRDDLVAVISGCCCSDIPNCPTPSLVYVNSVFGEVYPDYAAYDAGVHYQKERIDYADGGYQQWVTSRDHYTVIKDPLFYVLGLSETFTRVDPITGASTTTLSLPINQDSARAAGVANLLGYSIDFDSYSWITTFNKSFYISQTITTQFGSIAELGWTRYRWRVPDSFDGSYFKFTWDIIEEPDGWDDPSPTASRSFAAQDLTWEWTGPGNPSDPATWLSGDYVLEPPSVPGERRIVNIRFECHKSAKMGVAPQVFGEAIGDDEL